MEIENQSVLNKVFTHSIETQEPSPLKNIIVLPNDQLALIFKESYVIYHLTSKTIIASSPLQHPLESSQQVGENIVGLSENKINLVMIDPKTREEIILEPIVIEDNFLVQDVELFVFPESNIITLIYRQQLRDKKLFVFNHKLELVKTHKLQESVLERFDNTNCIVSYQQIIQNQITLSIFNVQTGVYEKIEVKHTVQEIMKQTLVVVKKFNNDEILLGVNLLDKSQWYLLNIKTHSFKLFFQGYNIGKLLKLHSNSQVTYFGYKLGKERPEGVVVTIYPNGTHDEGSVETPTNSYMDYSGYDSILIYQSSLKPISKINLQIVKSIKKRALMAFLIKNSALSAFGNGIFRSLFHVIDLGSCSSATKQSPDIPVDIATKTLNPIA